MQLHPQSKTPKQKTFSCFAFVSTWQNTESVFEGKYFFDLGYGNATGYHDVSNASTEGVPCSDGRGGPSWDDDSRDSLDPADVCYTGTYSTDAFVGRARQVSRTPYRCC